jgi:TolA-binding protein
MNKEEKRAAVLRAAEALFERLEEAGDPQVVSDAPRALGAEVDLSPVEIAIILRGLHRVRKIGLLEGVLTGNVIYIAPRQSLLQVPRAFMTGNGSVKVTKTRPGQASPRPATSEPEEAEPSVEQFLREQITALEGTITALRAAFEKEQRRTNRANTRRETAETKIRGLEATLAEARQTIRDLTRRIEELRSEANKVPGLLEEIAKFQGSRTPVPSDLARTLSRLASTYAVKES